MIKYPFTDFHEMNLDWIIENTKKASEEASEAIEKANAAKTTVDNFIANVIPTQRFLTQANPARWNFTFDYAGILITSGSDVGEFTIYSIHSWHANTLIMKVLPISASVIAPIVTTISDDDGHGIKVTPANQWNTSLSAVLIDLVGHSTIG